MHDAWLLSGHCAHSLDCDRWKTGCGHCPYLSNPPSAHHDETRYNWNRKKSIYLQSKLSIVSPSKWLMDKIEYSILKPSLLCSKVIHNGIDLNIYKQADKKICRSELNLPDHARIILFSASNYQNNPYKDFTTIQTALIHLGKTFTGDLLLVALGSVEKEELISLRQNVNQLSIPYIKEEKVNAKYYSAADIFLHAANADTYPTVIMESLACGTPVVATAVGGIPELIINGQTGYLVKPHDSIEMADRVLELLTKEDEYDRMSLAAVLYAKEHFGVDRMVDEYLEFYQEVINKWSPDNKAVQMD
jgi:glycosyltransferase involved in cell wall biosynthesis